VLRTRGGNAPPQVDKLQPPGQGGPGTLFAFQYGMTLPEAMVAILTSSQPPAQVFTLAIKALIVGAFNIRAARTMATVVRQSALAREFSVSHPE